MKSTSRWTSATIGLVVASLMIVGIEPAAFARPAEEGPSEERVVEPAPSKALPNRPVIKVTTGAPVDRVAQAISQSQNSRITPPSTGSSYTPPPRQGTGKSKKWIWIVAAAAGAAITVGVLAGKDDEPEATITLGDPSVGVPQ